jgi:hypothetical protein
MIICVGQGVGLCNHILNLGMGWTTPWGFQSSVFVNQTGLEMLRQHHLHHYKTCCAIIHWMEMGLRLPTTLNLLQSFKRC